MFSRYPDIDNPNYPNNLDNPDIGNPNYPDNLDNPDIDKTSYPDNPDIHNPGYPDNHEYFDPENTDESTIECPPLISYTPNEVSEEFREQTSENDDEFIQVPESETGPRPRSIVKSKVRLFADPVSERRKRKHDGRGYIEDDGDELMGERPIRRPSLPRACKMKRLAAVVAMRPKGDLLWI